MSEVSLATITEELLRKKGRKAKVEYSKKYKKNYPEKKPKNLQVVVKVLNGKKTKGHGYTIDGLIKAIEYAREHSIDGKAFFYSGKELLDKKDIEKLVNDITEGFVESSQDAKKKNRLFTHFSFSLPNHSVKEYSPFNKYNDKRLQEILFSSVERAISRKYPDNEFFLAKHDDGHLHIHAVIMSRGLSGYKIQTNLKDIQDLRRLFAEELAKFHVKLLATDFSLKMPKEKEITKAKKGIPAIYKTKAPFWFQSFDKIENANIETSFIDKKEEQKFKELELKFSQYFENTDFAFKSFLLMNKESVNLALWTVNNNPSVFGEKRDKSLTVEDLFIPRKMTFDFLGLKKENLAGVNIFDIPEIKNKRLNLKEVSLNLPLIEAPNWFKNKDLIHLAEIKSDLNIETELRNLRKSNKDEYKLLKEKVKKFEEIKEVFQGFYEDPKTSLKSFLVMFKENPKFARMSLQENPGLFGAIKNDPCKRLLLSKDELPSNYRVAGSKIVNIEQERQYASILKEFAIDLSPTWYEKLNKLKDMSLVLGFKSEELKFYDREIKPQFKNYYEDFELSIKSFFAMYQENPDFARFVLQENPGVFGNSKLGKALSPNVTINPGHFIPTSFEDLSTLLGQNIEIPKEQKNFDIDKFLKSKAPTWFKNQGDFKNETTVLKLEKHNEVVEKFKECYQKPDVALKSFLAMLKENPKLAMCILQEKPNIFGVRKNNIVTKPKFNIPKDMLFNTIQIGGSKDKKDFDIDKFLKSKVEHWNINRKNNNFTINEDFKATEKYAELENIFKVHFKEPSNALASFLAMYEENHQVASYCVNYQPDVLGETIGSSVKLPFIVVNEMNNLRGIKKCEQELPNWLETQHYLPLAKAKFTLSMDELRSLKKNNIEEFKALKEKALKYKEIKEVFQGFYEDPKTSLKSFLYAHKENPNLASWILKNRPMDFGKTLQKDVKIKDIKIPDKMIFSDFINVVGLGVRKITQNNAEKEKHHAKLLQEFSKELAPIWQGNINNIKDLTFFLDSSEVELQLYKKEIEPKFNTYYENSYLAANSFFAMYQENPDFARFVLQEKPDMFGERKNNIVAKPKFDIPKDMLFDSVHIMGLQFPKEKKQFDIDKFIKSKVEHWDIARKNNSFTINEDFKATEKYAELENIFKVHFKEPSNALASFLAMYEENHQVASYCVNYQPNVLGETIGSSVKLPFIVVNEMNNLRGIKKCEQELPNWLETQHYLPLSKISFNMTMDELRSLKKNNIEEFKALKEKALKYKEIKEGFTKHFVKPDVALKSFLYAHKENPNLASWILKNRPMDFGKTLQKDVKIEDINIPDKMIFSDFINVVGLGVRNITQNNAEKEKHHAKLLQEFSKELAPIWFENLNKYQEARNISEFSRAGFLEAEFSLYKKEIEPQFQDYFENPKWATNSFFAMYQENPDFARFVLQEKPDMFGERKNNIVAKPKFDIPKDMLFDSVHIMGLQFPKEKKQFDIDKFIKSKVEHWDIARKNNSFTINEDFKTTKKYVELENIFKVHFKEPSNALASFLAMYEENHQVASYCVNYQPNVLGETIGSSVKLPFIVVNEMNNLRGIKKCEQELPNWLETQHYLPLSKISFNMTMDELRSLKKNNIEEFKALKEKALKYKEIKEVFQGVYDDPKTSLKSFLYAHKENPNLASWILKNRPMDFGKTLQKDVKIKDIKIPDKMIFSDFVNVVGLGVRSITQSPVLDFNKVIKKAKQDINKSKNKDWGFDIKR